jgi:transcriptional regulator with XRE-family HTH domain
MFRTRHTSYLRRHRLKAALTLCELAGLLGVSTGAVWNYEAGEREVPAELLIASEVIFGVSAATIFPALYNSVNEDLAARARELHDRLEKRGDAMALKKLALISSIPDRLR